MLEEVKTMKQRKINIFLNNQYKTCKAALNAIRERGFIEYAGANWLKTRELDRIDVKSGDKLTAKFERRGKNEL